MTFQPLPAILAGLGGAAVMVVAGMVLRAVGIDHRLRLIRIWGTLFRQHGTGGDVAGWVGHLVVSVLVACAYAIGFQVLGLHEHLWLWGLLGAILHWLGGGLFLIVVPALHPEIPEQRPEPGAFALNYGRKDAVSFLIGHLAFGLTVGIIYGALARPG